jgi:sugar lactone lactonase YvrE
MSKVSMPKVRAAIVSLLVVACAFAFARWFSAVLAANNFASYLFAVLVLIFTLAGMGSGKGRRRGTPGKRFLRYAAPALLVPLGCGMSWASFGLSFQGLVQALNTAGITLISPAGIVVDPAGDVYIVDTGNSRIVDVNAQGVASVVTITALSPALSSPNGIAIDGSGNLYVADTGNSRVVEITPAGAGSVISTGSVTLGSPKGVALDQAGDLFIADTTNNRIVEVTSGGSAAVLAITVSSGSSTLNTPIGVAVDVTGKLYIADSVNNRIVTLASGSPTGVVASILDGVTLSAPKAVTVDRMGNVFIADTGNNRIAEIDTNANGDVLYTGSAELSAPLGVALDVFGTVYIADTGNNRALAVDPPVSPNLGVGDPSYSLNKTAVGFGHIQLGSSTPVTLTLPFTIGSTALGSVQVLTSGAANLDFVSGSGTTCSASTGTSAYCSVEITFLPTAPGLRMGSVVLYDGSGNPILTVPLYGWGDAPVAALSPNTGTVISTGSVTLSFPFQVALDGAANMYVANDGGSVNANVVRIPAGGGAATVVALGTPGGIPIVEIDGVAVDGAGNLFISDHLNNRILVVTPAGVVSILSITGLSTDLGLPVALAFDGAGNLYIADYNSGRIIRVSTLEVAGSTSSGLATVIGTGAFTFGEETLTGMTVDAQGNIYIAAETDNDSSVIKVTAAGVASELSFPGIAPALSNPQGVTVDAMGNLYVMDGDNPISRIVRLTTAGVASVLGISGLPAPSTLGGSGYGVTVDSFGNLYIPDLSNNRVVFVNVSGGILAFPSTDEGSSSAPQTTTVANLGDLPLIFSTAPTYTANFSEYTGDENPCALSTSLDAGTLCDVAVEFTPQSGGSLSTSIVVTNNSLNVTGTTESVAVSGTGVSVADTTAVAVSANPTAANIGQPLSVTAVVTDTATGHTATIPTGSVTFMDMVGSTSISLNGGAAVNLNGAGAAILTGVTLNGAGTHTITASYAGVTGTFLTSTNATTLTVSTDTAVIAGPATQPVQVVNGQAGSVPVTVTGPYAVVAAPTGSLSYTVVNPSSVSVAVGTATLTAGETASATTIPLGSTLAAGSYTVSLTYGGDSNYAAISTAVNIAVVVGAAVPTINWTGPEGGITYGATLSGILNAAAVSGETTVAGTFTYTAKLAGGSPIAVTTATVLAAGSYTLTATFTPTNPSAYASTSASVSLTVAKATPALALTSSAASVGVGTAVIFTATVSFTSGTPSGSVSFYDGTTLLGTGTLAGGVANYTTTNLPVGALSITAVYGGDSNFLTLTSSALTETVMTAFTVTAPTTPITVAPGGAATINITVPPLGGAFDNVVTLSASGLPPGATAAFNPPTVTPGSAGAPTVLTIQLAALAAGGTPPSDIPPNHRGLPLAGFSLGFVLFGAVLGRKRIPRGLVLVLALASLGVGTSLLTGCGGGFANIPSTAGNYTVTVTGTSGSIQASTTVTLVVE